MNSLKLFIEKYTSISDLEWKEIAACFELRTIEKDEILLKDGTVCKYLYFIESGLLRFFINKDGNEITKYFTDAPYFFTSQVSFTKELPSTENIQAIEKSVIWQASFDSTNKLLELQGWSTFVRLLLQEVQFYTDSILQEIQTETAEARYLKMIERNPKLFQRIPLKYLASYYGIAPQSLSRIRKKIIGK